MKFARENTIITILENYPIVSAVYFEHQKAFKAIKQIMTSIDGLTSIDYNLEENIYVTTDASLTRTRVVLSVGKFWGKAQLIVFDFLKYILAKHNYPIHEQEMLMII